MNHKRTFNLFIGTMALLAAPSFAQPSITLEGFGGWLWTGKAGYNGTIIADDKANWGARAGVGLDSRVYEFEWNQTNTTLKWYDFLQEESRQEDVTANYYMIGINQEIDFQENLIPYGVLNFGVMNLKGSTIDFSENWFTVGLGGGLKVFPSDRFGLRLQARILLPMQFAGIGVGCGTGGCGSGVSTYASTIQGDFTGGVILKLGG